MLVELLRTAAAVGLVGWGIVAGWDAQAEEGPAEAPADTALEEADPGWAGLDVADKQVEVAGTEPGLGVVVAAVEEAVGTRVEVGRYLAE